MQQPWLPLNNDSLLLQVVFVIIYLSFLSCDKQKLHAYWQLRTSSQKLYQFYFSLLIACEFYNLICHRRVWQLEMHLFLIFAPGTVIFWVCVIINSLKKHRPQCYTYISALCTDKQKMCDPILVNLLKMQAHYSQSSRGNATPSSSTSPLASYMEVPPPGFF